MTLTSKMNLGTSIALAALLIGLFGWLRADIRDLRQELRAVENRIVGVENRMARVEGLVEGLRPALAASEPAP